VRGVDGSWDQEQWLGSIGQPAKFFLRLYNQNQTGPMATAQQETKFVLI
jgi:hypothetical protein